VSLALALAGAACSTAAPSSGGRRDAGVDAGTDVVPGSFATVPGTSFCAASGRLQGGGFSGSFCLAPVEVGAADVSASAEYTWQAGPVYVIEPSPLP
jgi:hypothetical protein